MVERVREHLRLNILKFWHYRNNLRHILGVRCKQTYFVHHFDDTLPSNWFVAWLWRIYFDNEECRRERNKIVLAIENREQQLKKEKMIFFSLFSFNKSRDLNSGPLVCFI
jgi:hypothetical protein